MKLIKKGNPDPWWVGKQGTCWKCKTVIEFERGDQVDLYEAQDQRDNDAASLPCPVCDHKITVTPGGWA